MTTANTITFEIALEHASDLVKSLTEAVGEGPIDVLTETAAAQTGDASVRLGLDRRMDSLPPEAVLLTISGVGGIAIRSVAAIVIEHIKAKRTQVKLQRPDGSLVEIEGSHAIEELERLIVEQRPSALPPGEQA